MPIQNPFDIIPATGGNPFDSIPTSDATPPQTAASELTQPAASDVPQLSEYHPTLRQRASDLLSSVRRSAPVETLLGRTPQEIAASPALESAPTTFDDGIMGLFESKKPIVELYKNPTTALDGLHNWAAGVVNSAGSLGGILTIGLGSSVALVGKALGIVFGAQGANLGYEGAKDIIQNHAKNNGAQNVMDVGNVLAGTLMAAGGAASLKSPVETPTTGDQNATRRITSSESVPKPEVRPPVGQEAPLRQQGETPGTRQAPQDETRGQVQPPPPRQPSEPVTTPAAADTGIPSLDKLPPKAEGTTRLYTGGGHSEYATTDAQSAESYGVKGAPVEYVDVPNSVAEEARKAALNDPHQGISGQKDAHKLPDEWIRKRKPVQVQPKVYVLDAGAAVNPVQPNGMAARLSELQSKENKTPQEIDEQSKLQAASDSLKNSSGWGGFQKPSKKVEAPKPDSRVVVQAPVGDVPGFVQIAHPLKAGETEAIGASTPEQLRAAGHDVPDFSRLPQGRYTYDEAVKLAKKSAAEIQQPNLSAPVSASPAVESVPLDPNNSTGLTEDQVNKERAAAGKNPIEKDDPVSNEKTLEGGLQELASNPNRALEIMQKLRASTPENRSISRRDAAVLLAEKRRLMNIQKSASDIFQSDESSFEQKDAARQSWNETESKINEMDQAAQDARSVWGGFGQFWQRMLKEDYSFDALKRKSTMRLGRQLTESESADIGKKANELANAQADQEAKDSAYQASVAATAYDDARNNLTSEVAEESASEKNPTQPAQAPIEPHIRIIADRIKAYWDNRASEALKRLNSGNLYGDPLGVKMVSDLTDLGVSKILSGVADRVRWLDEMRQSVADVFHPYLEQVWNKAQKALDDSFGKEISPANRATAKRVAARKKPEGSRDTAAEKKSTIEGLKEAVADGAGSSDIGRYAKSLASNFVRGEIDAGRKPENIKGEEIDTAVHEGLKEALPDITLIEARDAWTGYGKYKAATKDPIKVRIGQARAEQQKLSTIERLQKGLAGLATGFARLNPTDLARRRTAIINQLKKTMGIVTTDPATQLKSALDAKLTRQKNRIADLKFENATRKRIVLNKAASPENEQTLRNKQEIADLEKQNREIFGNRKLTDEQKLKMATAAAEKNAVMWEEKAAEARAGRFTNPETKKPLSSKEIAAFKARSEAAKAEFKELEDLKNPKKTPEEIALNSRLARLKNQEADLADQLARNDFTPKPKPAPKIKSREALKAVAEATARVEKLKKEADKWAERKRLSERSPAIKLVDSLWKLASRGASTLAVSFHGTVFMVTHAGALIYRPSLAKLYWTNFARQFKLWGSEKFYNETAYRLKTDPDYADAKSAGVDIDPEKAYTDYEYYLGTWGKHMGAILGARGALALKVVRLHLYKAEISKLSEAIKADPEQMLESKKYLAQMINKSAGVTNLFGKIENLSTSNVAHFFLFAPKLYASRWARVVLDPARTLNTLADMAASKAVNKISGTNFKEPSLADQQRAVRATIHAAEFTATYLAAMAINQGLLSASGSNQKVNFFHPSKSDWLKFKVHGKVITADGGLLDPVRLIGQIVSKDLMARTAKDRYQRGNNFDAIAGDLAKYVRGKFSPSFGLLVEQGTGQDYQGRSVPRLGLPRVPNQYKRQTAYTVPEYLLSKAPIPVADASKLIHDTMVSKGVSSPDAITLMSGAAAAAIATAGVTERPDYSVK